MRLLIATLIIFFYIFPFNVYGIECGLIPTDGCEVTVDTVFSNDTYYLPNGIKILSNDVTLDCKESVLIGGGDLQNYFNHGILIDTKSGVNVKHCIVKNYGIGIKLLNSNNNELTNNEAIENGHGFNLQLDSSYNILRNNIASSNVHHGFSLQSGPNNNVILKNKVENNKKSGLYLDHASYNNLTRNTISFNGNWGIELIDSDYYNNIWINKLYGNNVEFKPTNVYCIDRKDNSYFDGSSGPSCP